ncbi:MAG: nucleotidyltransferase family protein [Bacteroidota bacterium]
MQAENKTSMNIGIVLLAAGSSSRLGEPKQLLKYDDQTLLQHSLQVAIASNGSPIVVVLGANAGEILKSIDPGSAHIVVNEEWQEGMGASIRYGIKTILQVDPQVSGGIIMVCDQPFITRELLNNLVTKHQLTGKPIITCSYAGTFGPPSLFDKNIFPELLQLKGDAGAKKIIHQHAGELDVILFPEGETDIDTKADYEKYIDAMSH